MRLLGFFLTLTFSLLMSLAHSSRQPSYGSTSTVTQKRIKRTDSPASEQDFLVRVSTPDGSKPPVESIDGRIQCMNFLLGTSILLTFHASMTASPFFLERLEGSRLQAPFVSYLSITYTATTLLFLSHATVTVKETSASRRLCHSLGVLAAINLLLCFSPSIPLSPTAFFFFVLINVAFQAVGVAYLRTAVVSFASAFGPSAMKAVMSGEAVVGAVVGIVQFTTAAAAEYSGRTEIGKGTEAAASLSFAFSAVVVACALGAHTWMLGMPSYRAVVQELDAVKPAVEDGTSETDVPAEYHTPARREIIEIAGANWKCNVAICYDALITLALFPPITSAIRSVHPISSGMFFSPAIFNYFHFLVMGVFDFIGRFFCSRPSVVTWSHTNLLKISLARTAFVPLFLLCNIQRPGVDIHHTTPLINSDVAYLLLVAAFGLSHGYLTSLCMMAASSVKHNPRIRADQANPAATIAQFFMVGGLALGSFSSFGVRAVVCRCNPFN
ncbi:hypothetical protein BOTBODRAFT_132592 [Botryobasidium botryosum FD-172 SS1]|uniref:Nucleoside transporter n=1 Tax=Botryobasidium botryosum (strain FD-172 SS1) TaxID=930990 RepID=A0A067MR77_BOTB1|nr:hypothetical protein BOTBODRAFT_132592 [Botryobasidium botryosum FD-172 SS1]